MTEALKYFLDEKTVCAEIDYPDTGIDYAFMLKKSDWDTLSKKWQEYSDDWKSAITYYAGFAYLKDNASIILLALNNKKTNIILQSLFSIYESVIAEFENPKSKNKINYTFSENDKQKILNELILRKNEFTIYPELKQLFDLVTSLNFNHLQNDKK